MTWAFAGLLVVWGNLVAYFVRPELPGDDPLAVVLGIALVAVSLAFARSQRIGASDLALVPSWRGLALGVAAGAAIALVGVLVLRFPPLLGAPVTYQPATAVSDAALLRHLILYLPLSVVIPEELAFRGALVEGLRVTGGARAAILGSGAVFACWHAVVGLRTLAETNISGPFFVLGLAGAFAVVFVGGVALASLRLRTGSLATTIGLHWAFNAVVLAGLRFS